MAARIKIDPPSQLPSSGVTAIQYKQWKVALKIFMHQTPEFREFYPGGLYPTWKCLEEDPNRLQKTTILDTPPDGIDKKEHLAQRRIYLETFLGIIARYSDEGDFDDIMEKSTSLEWIFQHHERRYGIQRKGRYLFRLDNIRFDKSTMDDYNKFYNDLRSCFKSNLRKKDEFVKYKNCKLNEDERISPTTECLLIQITLERIDSRLPAEIDRIFGYRMDDDTTLIDLQSEIFSYIPRALSSLDKEDNMSCNAHCIKTHQQQQTQENRDNVDLNAMFNRQQRPQQQQQQRYQQRQGPVKTQPKRSSQKFCKVCQALELPQSVIQSHYPSECKRKALIQEIQLEAPQYYENNYDEQEQVQPEYQD